MNGVLLFAIQEDVVNFSKPKVDYLKLAEHCASQISEHMSLPVSLVTNTSFTSKKFDKVINVNLHSRQTKKIAGQQIIWLNFDRCKCWDLTPYKNTLVMDTDFIIKNNSLSSVFDSGKDLLINKTYTDVNGRKDKTVERLAEHGIDMYWATVFYFKKNSKTKIFFNLVEHIQNNWTYYRMLYSIGNRKFRNDFAFSIAIHMLNGYTTSDWPCPLPDPLISSFDNDTVFDLDIVQGDFLTRTRGFNTHIMNKLALTELLHD